MAMIENKIISRYFSKANKYLDKKEKGAKLILNFGYESTPLIHSFWVRKYATDKKSTLN